MHFFLLLFDHKMQKQHACYQRSGLLDILIFRSQLFTILWPWNKTFSDFDQPWFLKARKRSLPCCLFTLPFIVAWNLEEKRNDISHSSPNFEGSPKHCHYILFKFSDLSWTLAIEYNEPYFPLLLLSCWMPDTYHLVKLYKLVSYIR